MVESARQRECAWCRAVHLGYGAKFYVHFARIKKRGITEVRTPLSSSPMKWVCSPWQKGNACYKLNLVSYCYVSSQVVNKSEALVGASPSRCGLEEPTTCAVATLPVSPRVPEPCPLEHPKGLTASGCYQLRHKRPAYQMLSLSATATHGVKGWNLTTEGTPGFLFRNIWSSSFAIPAQRDTQWASTYDTRDDVALPGPKLHLLSGDLGGHQGHRPSRGGTRAWLPNHRVPPTAPSTRRTRGRFSVSAYQLLRATMHERAQRSAMGWELMKKAEGPPFLTELQVAASGTHAAKLLVGPSGGRSLIATDHRAAEWGLTHWAPNASSRKEAPRGSEGGCFRKTIKRG